MEMEKVQTDDMMGVCPSYFFSIISNIQYLVISYNFDETIAKCGL